MEFTGQVIFFTAFFTMLFSQFLKMVIISIKRKKFYPQGFLELAGMPSSHTATITSLTLGIYFVEGFSPLLAFSLISLIYVIDEVLAWEKSISVHSRILNQFVRILQIIPLGLTSRLKKLMGRGKEVRKITKLATPMREAWGHTNAEVVAGFILGILTAVFVKSIL